MLSTQRRDRSKSVRGFLPQSCSRRLLFATIVSSNSDMARALASYLCAVDSELVNIEDFDNMEIKDCVAIESHFLEIASASITS